ncbi:MAG TPA: M14 family zinc carboxypeptidase, partial [Candidatus Sulfopaludibacter sp.]|nr:M14 family zinc carboxypeptidase [Candidatus Sulfopaludibacter sp.]
MRLAALSFFAAGVVSAAIQPPAEYFGFRIGADKKLVRYDKAIEYFQKVADESDRVRYRDLGPTTNNHRFVMLEISSAANLKNLDRYKNLERRLYFQGGAPNDAERDEIFRSAKAVVFITNNIHSTEIGASQMVIECVYRLATENSPEIEKILDNVIFLLVPSLNPDGQILVTDWYNKVVDTPYEATPLPYLYHPYT